MNNPVVIELVPWVSLFTPEKLWETERLAQGHTASVTKGKCLRLASSGPETRIWGQVIDLGAGK